MAINLLIVAMDLSVTCGNALIDETAFDVGLNERGPSRLRVAGASPLPALAAGRPPELAGEDACATNCPSLPFPCASRLRIRPAGKRNLAAIRRVRAGRWRRGCVARNPASSPCSATKASCRCRTSDRAPVAGVGRHKETAGNNSGFVSTT